MSRQSQGYDPQQADIFALGVSLFTLVFGIPPFLNATMQDMYYREFYQAKDKSSVPRFVRVHPATKSLNPLFDGSCSPSENQ
jgi:serine/threonine protein kinase